MFERMFNFMKNKFEEKKIDDEMCYICLEKDLTQKLKCGHFFHIGEDKCLSNYVKLNIMSRKFPLVCPMPDCGEELTQKEI